MDQNDTVGYAYYEKHFHKQIAWNGFPTKHGYTLDPPPEHVPHL